MRSLVAIIFLLIAISCEKISETSNSLLDHIPRDTQIIIKINNFEEASSALRDNNFIKNNEGLAFFSHLKKLAILDETKANESLLCFSPFGKNDFEYTYISKFDPTIIAQDSLGTKKIETLTYADQTIYKITSKEQDFFATYQDSILIASSSQLLVENAIRMKEGLIPVDADLQKVFDVSGTDNAISILINGKKLQNIHDSLLPNATTESLHNFSGWITTDAKIEQNAIFLNGVAIEKDSLSSTISIFDNTIAQENRVSEVTPISAKGFISFTYDDFNTLKRNLSKAQDRDLEDVPTELDDLLLNASEIGIISMEKEDALVLTSLDTQTLTENLQGRKVETYRSTPIYSYENATSFSEVLNPLIKNFEAKYYSIYDEFIFFGTSLSTMRDIISNILNKTLLFDQEYYANTVKDLSEESSILIVGTVNNIQDYIAEGVKEEFGTQWSTLKHKGYELGILQIIKENDFAHIHGILQKNSVKGAATSVIQTASTTLEHKLLTKPILVKNHRTKGLDVAVQDVQNNLYLISDKGTIFWKKQIDGEILGDIQQIDIYKNGRYQLLFNTANTLYLVDRDGKDVAPYPKKFETTITQPLSLFDYDKNKKYRIIITQGNKITMFNSEAEIVTGFRFKGTETDLLLKPKHIRIASKDHILLSEKSGKLTILDRLGKIRIPVKENINFSENEWYQYQDKFTSTTKDGYLVQIQKDGNVTKKKLALEKDNKIVSTNKTLVTFSENRLTIKGKTLELNYGVYTAPRLFYINDKIYVTITDIQSKQVYLYDSNGILFPNFPVYGNSALSLGNMDNDSNLEFAVQGEENNVLIYQIN
ncbi:hypothetical protein [Aquimarina pacifica]|uniref:hypothetical protein n=1 Tax=Aquimarina pacifica TaxID=1296415 RepID=UPI0004B4C631|nr:hypothetical protein [Aquimarina pacifica]